MKVAIIKYNAGNVHSVYCAVQRLGAETVLTSDATEIRTADRVIFPGVGHAAASMEHLNATGLSDVIRSLRQPTLGICIGLQLLCRHSEEGDVDCLGVFDTDVSRFRPSAADLKVPHMGWNNVSYSNDQLSANKRRQAQDTLLCGVPDEAFVYYVHSYRADICADTIATTTYGETFSAAIMHGNFCATQFHPEKSGSVGHKILQNFLDWNI